VCDSDLFIINVNANFPGSCHDSYVWEQSDLCYFLERKFSGSHNNSFLLGDSGYGLKPWLITPFRNESPARERRFNYILSQARSVIERTNGRLKNLFRCLNSERKLRYRPEIAGQIVVACCVIHNILISSQMIARGHHFFDEYAEEIPDRPINPQANHFDDGEVVRQRLMDLVVN
uniref:Uncharacterized protein n=1 Tax=Phlebotomus papatasi TaxID=29031 RepID=A0A1B0GQA0_PHLPP